MLAGIVVAAVVTDLRSRRIPNPLVVAGWTLALMWQVAAVPGSWTFDLIHPGGTGFFGWIIGASALLIAFLPLYAMSVMGAGDVKLMSVVGAFFGASAVSWTQLLGVAVFVCMAGGLLALVRAAASGQLRQVLSNVKLILIGYRFRVAGVAGPVFDAQADSVDRMPYAVAIGLGTCAYLIARSTGVMPW